MFNIKGLMSSNNQDWRTPKHIYEQLDKEFHFDFDPCPNDPKFNGLAIEWGKINYINPPYKSKLQDMFIEKAIQEHIKGKTIVLLIPARTDTKRFHRLLEYNPEIRFIKGRLKFNDAKGYAPFPSMIIILKSRQ